MTVSEFWQKVYFPTASRRLAPNSKTQYESCWRVHIQPVIGNLELQHVNKHAVSTVLDKMADAGMAERTVNIAWGVVSAIFTEAVESDYVAKNPAAKVDLPNCKETEETKALTEQEVRLIFERTFDRDRLMWRILLLTGARVSEMLALEKSDMTSAGLCIDESAYHGQGAKTKNRKVRYVPIPDSLRSEIEQWAATVPGHLLFPTPAGLMHSRNGDAIQGVLGRARETTGILDLTFRRCRTTFATLYDGDPRDAQAILGHSTIDLTMNVYRKPIAARQQADMEALEARLTGKAVTMPRKKEA